MSASIEIEGLNFAYRGQSEGKALDDFSLKVNQGEFLVVLGPSGAGKSTLANCLNGIIPKMTKGRYSGLVRIHGQDIAKLPVAQIAKEVGLVFQEFENQLFSTNVRLEIVFSPENFCFPRETMDPLIDEVLQVVGLEDCSGREPATLSGGQKQRLAIGSILAGKPKIICMDEPTTDLDPIGKLGVFSIAGKLRQESKITLVIIEHETEEALHADRVMIMDRGKILRLGTPREILPDIPVFDACGIMPLQIPKYFSRYPDIARTDLPLTPAEGLKFFREKGFSVAPGRHADLVRRDQERTATYGKVLIEVEGLTHTYPNGTTALSNVDLEVREGEFLAILGHNGSGKTTLAKHLNALLQPTRGQVKVCGMDTTRHSVYEIGKEIGYVFQNPDHQIFTETVFDEVAFGPRLRGVPEAEIKARVSEALHAVELDGHENADPFTLSKGERQRVAVASVLAAKPRIIILDEPTTGLDYAAQRKMMDLVRRLNEKGHAIIIITHAMWVAAEYAHRVVVVGRGKIAMHGTTREVFAQDEALALQQLRTPHVVAMSNQLKYTCLSVEELAACTERRVARLEPLRVSGR